ncbi:SdhB [uncultured Legionella sp.]|uniref:SdhB n=1 Tax=uncultured Legionella sp. TaxID=210934 RepID=UPI0026315FA6|nr:SdhB [uncultured Legionella sp.]
MSDTDELNNTLSFTIGNARIQLLETLQKQLEACIADQIIPQAEGVPFVNINNDPAQIASIKKVINALYHAEEALKIWEGMDTSTKWGKAKAAPQGVLALNQIYKSLGQLNDATPEIQSIIVDNYCLLEPVFSGTYEMIQKSGWISEFSKMEAPEKASILINKGTELLGSDKSKWNSTHPLLEPFSKLSQLINTFTDTDPSKKKQLPEELRRERILLIISLIEDLEINPFFQKITTRGLAETKAVNDLIDWFKSIQEDDFEFTQKSINKYISWANDGLPLLIVAVDRLERQNYLKSGLLSAEVIKATDKLASSINEQIASSSLNINERVALMPSFASVREQGIEASQLTQVQDIANAQNSKSSVADFFAILQEYKGKSFAEIIEPDRIRLRQIYPDIQYDLAHADFELENELANLLNTVGPAEKPVEPASKSWWQLATGAVSYVASFVVSGEIDKVIAKQNSVYEFINKKIASAQLKITVGEQARERIAAHQEFKEPIEERVLSRINLLKAKLSPFPERKVIKPGDIIPVKTSSLNNLRGNLTYLQELRLSNKVLETSKNINTLVARHLSESEQAYFSSPPYVINADEPESVQQIKAVSNGLYQLVSALEQFENISSDFGMASKAQMLMVVVNAGRELKQAIAILSPATRQALAPVIGALMAYGGSFSQVNGKESDLSGLCLLNQLDNALPEQSEELIIAQDIMPVSEDNALPELKDNVPIVSVENVFVEQKDIPVINTEAVVVPQANTSILPDAKQAELEDATFYEECAGNIANGRERLLNKFKTTLTNPLSSLIIPQSEGVPFINFEAEPPQVVAIKKVINCMYYAEAACRTRHKMNFNTNSMFDNVILAHQGVAALSQVYKSLSLFGDASPEIGKVIKNNHDLIEPMFRAVDQLIKSTGWSYQFSATDITEQVGSYLGQGLNLVQADKEGVTKTHALVNMLSDLPFVMNKLAKRLDPAVKTDGDNIQMTEEQIDSISGVAELFIEGSGSIFNLIKGPHALISLLDLSKKLNQEGDKLQNTTVIAYQEWIDKEYPLLLAMIDEIEVRNYLKPGLLSAALVVEIDAINKKLNETIESKQEDATLAAIKTGKYVVTEAGSIDQLRKINITSDLVQTRDSNLAKIHYTMWSDLFNNEVQRHAARDFFALLHKYEGKPFATINLVDRAKLRVLFAKIQDPMSFANLDLANEFLTALNRLETTNNKVLEVPFTFTQLLNQEELVIKYLEEQKKSFLLHAEVIDEARTQLNPSADNKTRRDLEQLAMLKARDKYLEDSQSRAAPGPGELKPVVIASTKTVRGSFVKVQELNLSAHVVLMKERFRAITKEKMSEHIQVYLEKPELESLHVINNTDPVIPRHIKQLENGLYHLQSALERFEKMDKNDAFVTQLKLIFEIEHEVRELKKGIYGLTPELKIHYGPLIQQVMDFSSTVQNIDYDTDDTEELQKVLVLAKEDLLTLKSDAAAADKIKKQDTPTAALRGLKLGIKYLHVASPQLERARSYLLAKYGHAFNPQPLGFRSFTREQLSDKKFMLSEVDRLNNLFDTAGYFDLKKATAVIGVAQQVMRVGAQAGELAGMVNKLIKDEYVHIKESSYKDYIAALSREEDYLCLKPGTLITQGMTLLNQLFLSAALELDMPFSEKLKLLDDAHYIKLVVEQIKDELILLEVQLKTDPLNAQLALNIAIKEDKIKLLNEQIALHKTKDINAIRSSLLDIQFEVDLRDALYKSFLKTPILEQYERAIRKQYTDNDKRLDILNAEDSGKALSHLLDVFERNEIGNYLIVSKAIKKLVTFGNGLPEHNQYVKDYLNDLVAAISNEDIPIKERADYVKSLPTNQTFIDTLSLASDGLSFLVKFKQFIERITQCIIEGLTTGANIISRYYEIKLEQKMGNIEKSLNFKAELNAQKTTEEDEQVELEQDKSAEVAATKEGASPVSDEDLEPPEEEYRSNSFR